MLADHVLRFFGSKQPSQERVDVGDLPVHIGHAKTLIPIEDPSLQLAVYQKILDNDLSVRKIEEFVRDLNSEKKKKKKDKPAEPAEHIQLEEQLKRYFQVDVQFTRNIEGKGKIVLTFKSDAELEQILGKLDTIK